MNTHDIGGRRDRSLLSYLTASALTHSSQICRRGESLLEELRSCRRCVMSAESGERFDHQHFALLHQNTVAKSLAMLLREPERLTGIVR